MAAPPMDSQYEQRLRDEVIYLHSLWHQGPPGAEPASASASASASAAPVTRRSLQPSKATEFKKEKRRRGKRGGKRKRQKAKNAAQESNSSPGAEWPCPSPPPPQPSTEAWPSLETKPNPEPLPLSSEEQLKLAARRAHQNALKVVHEFFKSNSTDDSDAVDSGSDDDDDNDEDDELMEEDDGREQYSFFFKVFNEDAALREYYEKNFADGEFSCLVCGTVGGKRTGKKFKGCLALVQHSITIGKTQRRRAHRALGQAVCKVLGWDIDQLPTIVSLLSVKSGETEGNVIDNKESSINVLNNVVSVEGDTVEGSKGDMNSLTSPDSGKNLEDLGMVHPHNVEVPASEGLTSNILTYPDADENIESLGNAQLHNVEQPASEVLTSVRVDENNGVGDEDKD